MHACTYLHTASSLVRHSESTRGDKSLIDRLSAVISVDKRMTLPHPLWSTKHDGILIHAIAKHGWIDNDASCRRITNDATIKWGFPFDSDHSPNGAEDESSSKITSQRDELINNLRDTAARAAALFNIHNDTLEEVKGFNKNLVIRAYSLVYENHDESDEDGDGENMEGTKSPRSQWVVDEAQLLASTGLESTESQEFVELPTKKDLVKRAKLILSKNVDLVGLQSQRSVLADAMKVDVDIPDNYFVLDQSDRCNVLLAEILKATVKAPYPKAQNAIRMMCAIATEEAAKRRESMALDEDQAKSKAVLEMAATIKNIDTAKRCLKEPRQAKNILRVILGVDIVKNPRGSHFPGKGSVGDLHKAGGQKNSMSATTKTKKEDSAVGDRALARAMTKCFDRNTGGPGRVLPEGHSTDLELTAIETLIISVVCSTGLPITDVGSDEEISPENNLSLSWVGLGSVLAAAAKEWHEVAAAKVEACQEEYTKYEEQESDSQPKSRARKNLANAIKIEEVKELAASQAADYSDDPIILAKKTIMLIERLRRKMGHSAGGHTKSAKKGNYYLGPKVFDFLSTQLGEWAASLDIVDASSKTLSYTAADFYHDLPVDERERVEVTTHLNKQDCRQLLIQITLISRLRSLILKYSKDELLTRVEKAARNLVGEPWEAQPSWWTSGGESPSHNDALLLESLVEFGFGGLMSQRIFSATGDDNALASLTALGVTKASVQQRANQLCQELHDAERRQFVLDGIHKRGAEDKGIGKKARKQTALSTFFSRTAPVRKQAPNVVVLSDTEDDTPPIIEITDDPDTHTNGTSPPSSSRAIGSEPDGAKFEDAMVASGGSHKRVSSSASDGSSSPEKKLRLE